MVKRSVKLVLVQLLLHLVFIVTAQEKVGVVLSGGGAKGLSHIGVLQALEDNNIPVDYICGTSMGAVIASFYAIGLSPSEMVDIVTSEDFAAWCSGRQEKRFESRYYREDAIPKMVSLSFRKKLGKIEISFPSSLVSPFPMDLAMIDTYASPSVAAGGDFSNLMVPFFCVSSDVRNKRPVIHTGGNLGSAVRASMTYPFVFKPITIDSTVLFDGGFYDNFPWRQLERLHSPNFIIGAKCVGEDAPLDDEDIVSQLTNMIVSDTDYNIPQEKGVVISAKYDYGVMEFDKAREIVALGYVVAQERLEEIKGRVMQRRSHRELDSMRFVFKQGNRRIMFSPDIVFEGSLDSLQQEFVGETIRGGEGAGEGFGFNTLRQGYYRLASSGLFRTLYPSYMQTGDSLLFLKLKGSAAYPLEVYMGGNISSSSNQGYAGVKLQRFGKRVWNFFADVNIGEHYLGAGVRWRHYVGLNPLLNYDFEAVAHKFSYRWHNVEQKEVYFRGGVAVQLGSAGSLLLKGNICAGRVGFDSPWSSTYLDVFSISAGIEKNTLNYPLYPTEGTDFYLKGRWRNGAFGFKGHIHSYIKVSSRFTLGYIGEISLQQKSGLGGYVPTLLFMPAFSPFPASSAMLLSGYRADTYAGFGISPVICLAKRLFLHTNISYFQPYRQIYERQGGDYGYGGKFPRGAFIGNASIVWHSPIGPVSLSAAYYEKGEQKRWYPQLDIGLLLFKKKFAED